MLDAWSPGHPIQIDPGHISHLITKCSTQPLCLLVQQALSRNLSPIIVTDINISGFSIADFQEAMGLCGGKVALRIDRGILADFESSVRRFLLRAGTESSRVDLIYDMQFIETLRFDLTSRIGRLEEYDWNSITLLAGAFPKDLAEFTPGMHFHPRLEWTAWTDRLALDTREKLRFGDYTIQHGFYSEPPSFSNPSASIRYTTENNWLIMRGQGLRTGTNRSNQYPANTELLVDTEEFCGADFSYGDSYILTKVGDYDHPGNPGTWLQAGINHHITYVVRQLNERENDVLNAA